MLKLKSSPACFLRQSRGADAGTGQVALSLLFSSLGLHSSLCRFQTRLSSFIQRSVGLDCLYQCVLLTSKQGVPISLWIRKAGSQLGACHGVQYLTLIRGSGPCCRIDKMSKVQLTETRTGSNCSRLPVLVALSRKASRPWTMSFAAHSKDARPLLNVISYLCLLDKRFRQHG
jgi:hypothetical protein